MSGGNIDVQSVAKAFVSQYYSHLHNCPEVVHKFYQESSLLGWPGADDAIISVTTLEGINEKIMSSDYKERPMEIKTADAQESVGGGVVVAVTGRFTVEDNTRKNFTQTFFLAKQEKGFYVLNDILRFIDVCESLPDVTSHNTENDQATPTCDSEPANVPDHPASSHTEPVVVDGIVNGASGPSVIDDTVAGVAVSKPSDPSQENVHPVVENPVKEKEDAKKVTYASMVSKASSTSPILAPAYKTAGASTNTNQQLVTPPVPKSPTDLGDNTFKVSTPSNHASKSPTLPSKVGLKVSTRSSSPPNANTFGEARGIYIGGLPYHITKNSLIEVVSQFGQVRRINDCVQIKKHEDGFCCGFVEFESSDAAHRAVKAHHVTFGEKEAYIMYKRSNRGGNREGASAPARGGFRNGNFRGGENGEGNSYRNRRFQNGNQTGFRKGKNSSSQRSTEVDHFTSENGSEGVAASNGVVN